MHIVWYTGHCRIIDLDLHYNAMSWGKLKIQYMTYYIAFHTKFDHKMHYYEVKFIICDLYVTFNFKCHPTSARPRNFRIIQQNCTGPVRKSFLRKSVKIGNKQQQLCTEMRGNQIWLRFGLNWLLNLILTAVKM